MGVIHNFQIVQMVPNCAKRLIFSISTMRTIMTKLFDTEPLDPMNILERVYLH